MRPTPTTQRAVILAAGLGSRLHPLTAARPKPLVAVHGVPILHNALRNLAAVGVTEATIVVGYCKEAIQRSCGTFFAGIEITYCESSVFERTGSAYSLWLARHALLAGDTFLLEGDVFFDAEVLRALAANPAGDVAAVAPFSMDMSGSAVTVDSGGLIDGVHMNHEPSEQVSAPFFKTMNLMRLSGETLGQQLVPALDRLIADGATRSYVEELLAQLIGNGGVSLHAVHCGQFRWYEIDSTEDLRAAEAIFAETPRPASPAASASGG